MISCYIRQPREEGKSFKFFPVKVVVTVKVTPYSILEAAFKEAKIDVLGSTATVLSKIVKLEDNIAPSDDVQKINVSKVVEEAVKRLKEICPSLKKADAIELVLEQGDEEARKDVDDAILVDELKTAQEEQQPQEEVKTEE